MPQQRDAVLEEAFQRRLTIRRIAEAAGISHAAVGKWRRVPAHQIDVVSKVTGIPRWLLRPDIYKRPAPRKPPRKPTPKAAAACKARRTRLAAE